VAAVETNPGGVAHDVSSQPNDFGIQPRGGSDSITKRRSRETRRPAAATKKSLMQSKTLTPVGCNACMGVPCRSLGRA
jgi:hypothetical protein